jgi:uncharacterized protein (TIGR02271 family)
MKPQTEQRLRREDVRDGMTAYTQDGEKLGKVIERGDDYLTVEKGFFFPKDFTMRYDDIIDIRDDDLIVRSSREDLGEWREEQYAGWQEAERRNRQEEEARIPVREEELEAQKVSREKERARVRKVVHTEMKNFSIPVEKEELVVERKPASAATKAGEGEAFKEEEKTIPIREEEAEVVKKPKVKEEVSVHKEKHEEKQPVSGEAKKEEVRIEK